MTTVGLLVTLRDSLESVYPTRMSTRSTRAGAVTCVIQPDGAEYDEEAQCDVPPYELSATVAVIAAATGDTAAWDLAAHADPVAALIVAAGWTVESWTADAVEDVPTLLFSTTARG